MKRLLTLSLICLVAGALHTSAEVYYANLSDYGLRPNKSINSRDHIGKRFQKALGAALKLRPTSADTLIVQLAPGDYYFASETPHPTPFYISNHDHSPVRYVGISLDSLSNVVIDGQGSTLFFEAPAALPVAITNSTGCKLSNFSIDYPKPHILQAIVVDNDTVAGDITLSIPEYVDINIKNGKLTLLVDGADVTPWACIAFEENTGRVVYRTSDVGVGLDDPRKVGKHSVKVKWRNQALIKGTRLALRNYARPCPAIFVDQSEDISFSDINVHYAEGMGLLAQNSSDISLRRFKVLRSARFPERMHTTQADATHFSGCRGKITSVDGIYEGMMDDAINIHGTYLKVTDISADRRSLSGAFMHGQSFGFKWADLGDSVAIVRSKVMDAVGVAASIEAIEAIRDTDGIIRGYHITLSAPIPSEIDIEKEMYGIENFSATPEIYFAGNIVRNNRARGALFSAPRRTIVERNLFDHTSGTAILLCGDCNGWFESGACRDILIRNNRFVNALTSLYQFTNAVISIYPEIPDLGGQQGYFHSGIEIRDNLFETFDLPILYAKSVDGLKFIGNKIKRNNDYAPYHPNDVMIRLERVTNVSIE